MKTMENLTRTALTGTLAPPTKAALPNIAEWAAWLKLKTHQDRELEALVFKCAEFSMGIRDRREPRWLSLLGTTGTGKTHCAKQLWTKLRNRLPGTSEYQPSFIYWPQFVNELRGGEAYGLVRDMQRWPLLCLDDVGAERDTTGFASEHLNTLLGCRAGKWTILTSNLNLEQLGVVDNRIADRIIRQPNLFVELSTESHSLRQLKT